MWEGGDAAPPARPRTMYQDYPGNFDTSSRGSSGSPGHPETYSSGAAQQVGPGDAPLPRCLRGRLRALPGREFTTTPGERPALPPRRRHGRPGERRRWRRRCRGAGLPAAAAPSRRPYRGAAAFLPSLSARPGAGAATRPEGRRPEFPACRAGSAAGGTACPERGREVRERPAGSLR